MLLFSILYSLLGEHLPHPKFFFQMLFDNSVEEDVLLEEEVDVDSGNPADLIVYNDDHNTFDWVMKCFMEILGHSSQQSEQLALMIHFKGKAKVKSATLGELRPIREALVDRGLSATIEQQ